MKHSLWNTSPEKGMSDCVTNLLPTILTIFILCCSNHWPQSCDYGSVLHVFRQTIYNTVSTYENERETCNGRHPLTLRFRGVQSDFARLRDLSRDSVDRRSCSYFVPSSGFARLFRKENTTARNNNNMITRAKRGKRAWRRSPAFFLLSSDCHAG